MKKLCEMLETQKDEHIIWESAFQVSFTEFSNKDSEVKSTLETE